MRAVLVALAIAVSPTLSAAYSGASFEVCRLDPAGDNFLALRTGPGSSHSMVMQLSPGSVVEARGDQRGKWLQVVVEQANGQTYLRDLPRGYVYTDYLCPMG